nr:hypothetical protein [Candidatus Riesia pediculicola]
MLEKKAAKRSSNMIPTPFFIFFSKKFIGNGLRMSKVLNIRKLSKIFSILGFSKEAKTKNIPENSSKTIKLWSKHFVFLERM